MNQKQNYELAQRWIEEVFNRKQIDVIDEIFAEDFFISGNRIGRERLKIGIRWWLDCFPDLRIDPGPMLSDGDKISFWYNARGTQNREFFGIPATYKTVRWVGNDVLRISDGLIVEGWFIADRLGLVRALGASLVLKTLIQ